MNRPALGIVSLVLFVVGVVMMATAGGEGDLGGVFIRASVVLGAIWFVLPNARSVHRAVWAGSATFALFVILAPRLILWGIAVSALASVVGFLAKRKPGKSQVDRPGRD
ncbi:MAG: hypothetical protein OEM40_03585 [Acidimicrobiia bacterium]|nr:hypothetical protein [Acidimicrobiia bacterium]MDH5505094.1 hypothetical protein [Acidimicrobiia bacterium]